ncbi:hypothetical protein CSUI_005318 [Cystoisospora suis]|uniref:Uncharacterized protein n=1 Tax=Cystoisospora suis TaxID=483139 RepID=A0A2C6KY07_9APIC|nr:hypothetical protein CSUI_005318 [Cystoisospora suis]
MWTTSIVGCPFYTTQTREGNRSLLSHSLRVFFCRLSYCPSPL